MAIEVREVRSRYATWEFSEEINEFDIFTPQTRALEEWCKLRRDNG